MALLFVLGIRMESITAMIVYVLVIEKIIRHKGHRLYIVVTHKI